MTFLAISCYFKGADFLRACKALGNTVYLLTAKNLEHEPWPRESLDDIFYIDNEANTPANLGNIEQGLAWLLRSKKIDRIIALDDFDVEKAAWLREQFRIPGMGQTTARYFRDKLAMRIKAQESGIPVPPFSPLFNDEEINHYLETVPAPWVVKPRSEASATGIKKFHDAAAVWEHLHTLGDDRYQFLIEQFKPGDVYHADALSMNGKNIFCRVSRYLATPFDVAHGGGIFRTHTVPFGGAEDKALQKLTQEVMKGFGMQFSASHTEFIRSHDDGKFYFLETSSRVGGAHIAEMVTYSSGINLWYEWAKIETAMAGGAAYKLPKPQKNHAGLLVSLSRFEWPDTTAIDYAEIVWRIKKSYHVGFIVVDKKREVILERLDQLADTVARDFHASAPAPDKSVH